MTTTGKKPEKTFRIGTTSAAVWKNATAEGKSFYSVTFERRYRTKEGYKTAHSFYPRDLLNFRQLAARAESYIAEQTAT